MLLEGQTHRSMDRDREPEKDTHKYIHVIFFLLRYKMIQWRNDSLFNKWCWNNWTSVDPSKKLNHKLNLTRIKTTQDGSQTSM